MKSTFKKIVIPLIIIHFLGDVVNRAGNLKISDKVNTPTPESPYIMPSVGSKTNMGTHSVKSDMEWSSISGHKGDVS